ncbi:hypothetical protein Ancab_032318 [Ancistrocladus abbreviatus]
MEGGDGYGNGDTASSFGNMISSWKWNKSLQGFNLSNWEPTHGFGPRSLLAVKRLNRPICLSGVFIVCNLSNGCTMFGHGCFLARRHSTCVAGVSFGIQSMDVACSMVEDGNCV